MRDLVISPSEHRSPIIDAVPEPPRLSDLVRRQARGGMILTYMFVVGGLVWASTAPLAEGAVASGIVSPDGSRRTVQHLEGGIIRELLVRDGAIVREGDVLLRLDDIQAGATTDNLRAQLDAVRALQARLVAERDNLTAIEFPADLVSRRSEPRVSEVLDGQQAAFDSGRQAVEGQKAVLRQRAAQYAALIQGSRGQISHIDRQLRLIGEELAAIEPLVEQKVIAKPRYLSLQREAAALAGAREQQLGAIAQAEQGIGEAEMQILQLDNNIRNEIASQLQEIHTRIAEYEERLRGARDVHQRREVLAPVGGIVTNLRFFTPGGVVRPGEPLLDIVPRHEELVVDVRVSPTDIDVVEVGMQAEVKLSAFRQRAMPILHGTVTYVAADISADTRGERTDDVRASSHYRATVRLNPGELDRIGDRITATAGMPAEVLILAGERSVLSYLWQPIRDSLRRAFREQ